MNTATTTVSAWGRLSMLWQRELWEHRSLWIAPLVASGLLLVILAAGVGRTGGLVEDLQVRIRLNFYYLSLIDVHLVKH